MAENVAKATLDELRKISGLLETLIAAQQVDTMYRVHFSGTSNRTDRSIEDLVVGAIDEARKKGRLK